MVDSLYIGDILETEYNGRLITIVIEDIHLLNTHKELVPFISGRHRNPERESRFDISMPNLLEWLKESEWYKLDEDHG